MKYNVVFAYSIRVEADDEKGAEEKAIQEYIEINPTINEMGIQAEQDNE